MDAGRGVPRNISLATDSILSERVANEAAEMLASIRRHGFRRILIVNGHGGNSLARPAAEAWAERHEGVQLRWHDWWKAPDVRAAIDAIDPDASHASWMETFEWTRVEGIETPEGHKSPVDLSDRNEISPARFRQVIGDGSFGGDYERSSEEMTAIWKVAVRDTRSLLTEEW